MTARMRSSADSPDTNNIPDHGLLDGFDLTAQSSERDLRLLYARELENSGSITYLGSFGPQSEFFWLYAYGERYALFDTVNGTGRDTFRNALGYAARETAVDILPLDEWREDGMAFGRFMAGFVAGSLGDTLEDQLESVAIAPTEAMLERVKTANDNGALDYGVKIVDTRPYIYAVLGLGHIERRPIILDTRCYSLLDSRRTGIMRLQEQAVIPLFDSCNLVAGATVYPTAFRSPGWKPSVSLLLERSFPRKSAGKSFRPDMAYIGFKVDSTGTLAETAFIWPW